MDTTLAFASVTELAGLVARREVASVELVQLFLDRIDRLDGELNSYVHLLAEDALAQAEAKDGETASGAALPPLHGVPVAIKELSLLAGAPATMAARALSGMVSPVDSASVAALKRAGAIPLGKTNAPEFGTVPYTEPELYGPCRNPWNTDHTPGGSSGGSAAAVAAGLAPVAEASDGGGSIRIPASATGLVGLKPSRFRISSAPLTASFSLDLATNGSVTRTVTDTALLLDLMSGYVPGDPAAAPPPVRPFVDEVGAPPGGLRIGVLEEGPFGAYASPVGEAVARTRELLEEVGHRVEPVTVALPDQVVEAFGRVWMSIVASHPVPTDRLEPFNAWLAERGRDIDAATLYAAEFRLGTYARWFSARFHTDFDLLLLPVLTQLPPSVGSIASLPPQEAWDRAVELVGLTPVMNASGQPSISLPVHRDADTGLPVGVQLVAPYAGEATLLQVAAQLEDRVRWHEARPPRFGA